MDDSSKLISTGQAAKLCCVNPDTVRKWVRKGLLRAVLTAGGHHRISPEDLAPFVGEPLAGASTQAEAKAGRPRPPLRCWEYMSEQGVVREECRSCVVHHMRTARCFAVANAGGELGHARLFCQDSCEECSYYGRVVGGTTNILVITSDKEHLDRVRRSKVRRIKVRFVRNAYEASTVVQVFRPAFVVVDQEHVIADNSLLESLASDLRVPGLKIILAVNHPDSSRQLTIHASLIDGELQKPVNIEQFVALLNWFPVESSIPENESS